MIKVIATVRRRPGMTRAEYLRYIEHVHGGLARANPVSLQRYMQYHVEDAAYGASGDPEYQVVLPRDSVTELSFADFASMRETFSHPYTREVIQPDGQHFGDLKTSVSLITTERDVMGDMATRDGAKVLFFLSASRGVEVSVFEHAWAQASTRAFEASEGIRGSLRNVVVTLPTAASDPAKHFAAEDAVIFSGVQSVSIPGPEALERFRAYEKAFTEDCGTWLDRSRSFWLLTREVTIIG